MNLYKTIPSVIIAALLMSANFVVQAEDTEVSGISTFGELDQLRAQNAVLTEAVKNAELKSKLNNLNKEGHSASSFASANLSIPRSAQVELVSGIGNKMHAQISLPDGRLVLASVGTKIPHLGVVKSISINNVMMEEGKQLFSLPFAAQTQSTTTSLLSNPPSMQAPVGAIK